MGILGLKQKFLRGKAKEVSKFEKGKQKLLSQIFQSQAKNNGFFVYTMHYENHSEYLTRDLQYWFRKILKSLYGRSLTIEDLEVSIYTVCFREIFRAGDF